MALKRDPLHLEQQLCFQLYLASKSLIQAYAPLLEPLDLTYLQYLVMMILWEDDEISVKSLGDKLHLDSGTLSPLLKRLIAKTLVIKFRAQNDERSVVIRLTQEGKALRTKAQSVPESIWRCTGLKPEEAQSLFASVRRLNAHLTTQDKPSAPIRKQR